MGKMNKQMQIEAAEKHIRENTEIDYAQVDLEALIDSDLHFNENWNKLKEKLGIKTETEAIEDYEKYKEKMQEKRTEQFNEELEKNLEDIKTNGKDVENYYKELRGYVSSLIDSGINSLVIYSRAGLGKSYQVQAVLKEKDQELGRDYVIFSGYMTPLELYHNLYENRDKTIILDDVEGIAQDPKSLSLLKAGTWAVGENRTITYNTTSKKLEAPEKFEFTGKLIICLNRQVNDPDFEALKSRSIYHELSLNYEDIINGVFPKIAEDHLQQEEAEELVNFIRNNTNPSYQLEIRDLIKAVQLYEHGKAEGKDWEMLVNGIFDSDEELDLVWELMNDETLNVNEKVKRFKRETGKSRKTYYNKKSEIEKQLKTNV